MAHIYECANAVGDAIGDVDPVAEADVYLAYGRDLQAEEILKEAMRSSPELVAVMGRAVDTFDEDRARAVAATFARNRTWRETTPGSLNTVCLRRRHPSQPVPADHGRRPRRPSWR